MWFKRFGLLVAVLWAWSGFSLPVPWSQGNIIYSGGSLYLSSVAGSRVKITGMEFHPESVGSSLTVSIDGKQTGILSDLRRSKYRDGEAISGIKAQLVRHRNDTYLALFNDDLATELGSRVFFSVMKASASSDGTEIVLQDQRMTFEPVKLEELNFSALEWSVFSDEEEEKPNFHFFVYDREAAQLYFGAFSKGHRSENKQQLMSILSMPEEWRLDEPFDHAGELRYSVREKSLELYSHESPKPILVWGPESGFRHLEEAARPKSAREIKLAERLAWQSGLETILKRFSGSEEKVPEEFKSAMDHWIEKGIGPDYIVDFHVVGVAQSSKNSQPKLIQNLLHHTVESFSQRLSSASKELPHTFIRFPGTTSSIARLMGTIQTLSISRPSDEPLYWVIDASDGDQPYHQNATAQLLSHLAHLFTRMFPNQRRVARIVVFVPEKLALSSESQDGLSNVPHQISTLSPMLSEDDISSTITHALRTGKPSFNIQPEKVTAFLKGLAANSQNNERGTEDLDKLIQLLRNILDVHPDALATQTNIQNSSRAYLKLSGNRTFEPISSETISKITRIHQQFSANSPLRGPTHFHARDLLLNSIQDQLLAFELFDGPTGVRKFLPLFFMGDPGTGKTSLALALADYLGGATEVVNASELREQLRQPGREYSSKPEEEILRELIEAKIARLWLSPSAFKVLIIDEAHSVPAFLKTLLSALGDGDANGSESINLNGIVVLFTMNIDDKSKGTTTRLSQLSMNHEEYPELLHRLFVDTFTHLVSRDNRYTGQPVDPKHIEALASRVLTGLYFFPPITHEKHQAESLIYSEVESLEQKTHARIIVHPQAMDVLKTRIRSYGAGNFRTAERAIRLSLSEAIARYLAANQDGNDLGERVFLLRADPKEGVGSHLHFLDLNHSPEGRQYVLSETHRQLVSSMKLAISQLVEQNRPSSESSKSHEEILLTDYRKMLEAFRTASAKPLFDSEKLAVNSGLKLDPGPKFSAMKLAELGKLLSNELRDLFEDVYRNPRLVLKPDSVDGGAFAEKLIDKASLVLRAVSEIQKELGLEEEKHEWLKEAVSDFESQVGSGNKQKRREEEVAFLNVSLEEYTTLQESLSKTALENEKQKLISDWSRQTWTRYQDLKTASPDVNLKLIEQFIDHLSSRSEATAREILQGLTDDKAGDGPSGQAQKVLSPVSDYVRIGSGYYLDALLRAAASEAFEISKQPRWELTPPSTNGQSTADPGCQALVMRLRKAQETLGPIFKKPN